MKAIVLPLVLVVVCAWSPRAQTPTGPSAPVLPGIEVFVADVPQALRGKRVGLITNQSGIDRARTPDIDLIARHKDLSLVVLLAPEHGIRGNVAAGEKADDETDAKTGVPISRSTRPRTADRRRRC